MDVESSRLRLQVLNMEMYFCYRLLQIVQGSVRVNLASTWTFFCSSVCQDSSFYFRQRLKIYVEWIHIIAKCMSLRRRAVGIKKRLQERYRKYYQ